MNATQTPNADPARAKAIACGRAGKAWELLEALPQLLDAYPSDNELRFLGASVACGLGLGTLARELIAGLAPAARSHPGVAKLSQQIEALSDDQLKAADRIANVRANLESIASGRTELGDWALAQESFEHWAQAQSGRELFRARDGNIVERLQGRWVLCDRVARSAQACNGANLTARPMAPVVALARGGQHLLESIVRQSTPDPCGPRRAIVLMGENASDILDAMSCADLSSELPTVSAEAFTGPASCDRLGEWLRAREAFVLPSDLLAGEPMVQIELAGKAQRTIAAALSNQSRCLAECQRRIAARFVERDREWWSERFAQARTGGHKLRVLVQTTRYSTFIKHSSRDLCQALERAGIEWQLLIEPDDTAQRSALDIAQAIDRFDPDLFVLINFPRAHLGDVVPANLPFVTWVQDAMPHLFAGASGGKAGAFDWLMGHLFPELLAQLKLPASHMLPRPVLVSMSKFHAGAIEPELAARMTCDIAYVSHHSVPPEELARDLSEKLERARPGAGRVVDKALEALRTIITPGMGPHMLGQLDGLSAELVGGKGASSGESAAGQLRASIVYPLAERLLRHQMLEWAEAACARRGWQMKLFGRGWEKHPTLAPHACGEIAHDEELRALYQCARVNLHAGFGSIHQRVMECALSGGCSIVRIKSDDLWALEWWAQHDIASGGSAKARRDPTFLDGSWNLVNVCDHWQAMMVKSARDRVGLREQYDRPGVFVFNDQQLREPWGERFGHPLSFSAAWLVGDPTSSGFWDAESFERAAQAVIESPARRQSLARWQARCTQENYTLEALARTLPGWIERGLSSGTQL